MKKMSSILALSISTAIICGLWSYAAGATGLISWAGFAGCTTYFASGKHGIEGIKKAVIPNIAGVCCGMLIINLSNLVPFLGEIGVWCALLTFVMCMLAKYELLDFCPGTFMGCFTTFAANGNWKCLTISLIIGAILGLACDLGGNWIYQRAQAKA